ncbi:MAG: RNA polymerase sigma factor [Deltaproteobacteria bacterium]|nr:RNA polymerase sigma factor [Deltaproteobacteria bacterium]
MQDDIAQVRKYDREALAALFGRHMQQAYAVSFQLCAGDREQARDLTQDALLKAVRTIDTFKGEAAFQTWLYRIIYTTFLDSRKSFVRWAGVFSPVRWAQQNGDADRDIPEEPPDSNVKNNPLNALQEKQLDRELHEALHGLPAKQRIVFQFKVFNDMSIKDIAHVLNCAEGTVKSHLFRATQHLQKTLRDWA